MSTVEKDRIYLEGLARNDRASVESIYREHFLMVEQLIINNNGTGDEARDIFQEAMIVLYEKARSGSFELNCLLKTYIYSVCRRLWLKNLSQQQRFSRTVDLLEETVPVEEELERHGKLNTDFLLMENAMVKIGEPCKSLLDAYYIQKKGMQEIADNFGYTNADNAKTQKYKCLVRLKKLFFAQYKNG